MNDRIRVRRALISVADKRGLVDFATRLHGAGIEIVSSGGTHKALSEAGIPVTPVAEVTGAAEMLGGRVKTLHPNIHGGILADLANSGHVADMEQRGIAPFQLVVVNLYPFESTVAPERCDGVRSDRADRHRRTDADQSRRQESRVGRCCDLAQAVRARGDRGREWWSRR